MADRAPERADGQIDVRQDLVEPQTVSLLEGPFEQRSGNLKPDAIVVLVGSVAVLRYLRHIKPEFRLYVRPGIVLVCDAVTVFGAQLGESQRHRAIDERMAAVIGGVMRQRAQREGVLVEVGSPPDKAGDKVTGADIMGQVAEELVAEWVIP